MCPGVSVLADLSSRPTWLRDLTLPPHQNDDRIESVEFCHIFPLTFLHPNLIFTHTVSRSHAEPPRARPGSTPATCLHLRSHLFLRGYLTPIPSACCRGTVLFHTHVVARRRIIGRGQAGSCSGPIIPEIALSDPPCLSPSQHV